MHKVLFVVNPISGGIDKEAFISNIKAFSKSENIAFNITETTGKNDREVISSKIAEFDPETVVACGGDGTINLVAQMLLGKNINLGIIPLGSANGLATELLIPKKISQAIKVISKKNIIPMDVLRINDKFLSLHLSDIGFNAKLIRNFEKGGSRGMLSYVFHFFKVLFKKAPRKYTFTLGENQFSRRAEMVVFANASQYGTGAIVNPDGLIYDKKFEVCIFKPYPWYAIFRIAFDFFTGRMKKSRYVKIFSTREITVKSNRKAPLQVDGEVVGDFSQVKVTIEDEQLHIIVPQEFKKADGI